MVASEKGGGKRERKNDVSTGNSKERRPLLWLQIAPNQARHSKYDWICCFASEAPMHRPYWPYREQYSYDEIN